ncbi:hypothetical protein GWK47_030396 [Chionoecetes opilio]|uniref:Uncharacterized protein n=1 Tax=Chionoecetes opilio TaxID=41210 RepID=A0A8J4YK33_CHIOP|nr:hypothetical protein GWK47_030396 [Chionoecetes opilio]
MVVSRSPLPGLQWKGGCGFGGVPLPLQEAVKVLGVEVDRELRFDGHIKHIAKKASHRVSALRRVARFLDRGGKLLLYKAQIRPYLEYAALLDVVRSLAHSEAGQHPASSPANGGCCSPPDPPDLPALFEPVSPLDSLEHRRDVAVLVVFHKAQVQGVPHLAGLRQPPRVATRSTRTVLTSGDAVEVPRSRASQHQRTFVGRVSRMWNIFTAAVPHIQEMNTQSVKLAANRWRLLKPTPLRLVILWTLHNIAVQVRHDYAPHRREVGNGPVLGDGWQPEAAIRYHRQDRPGAAEVLPLRHWQREVTRVLKDRNVF